jgi:hypothetical protein
MRVNVCYTPKRVGERGRRNFSSRAKGALEEKRERRRVRSILVIELFPFGTKQKIMPQMPVSNLIVIEVLSRRNEARRTQKNKGQKERSSQPVDNVLTRNEEKCKWLQ